MMKVVGGGKDPDSTMTSAQLEHNLEGCDAHACVVASYSPSVQVYYALRSQLELSSTAWLQDFVSFGGLDSLLDSLCQMNGKTFTSFSDAILQIDCISCIRAILNTRLGIDYLLHSEVATKKLVKGLEISNTLPKKQILEMMAALCTHSPLGYRRVLEGLEQLKQQTNQYHSFSIVVNELKLAETVPHKTAVLTFINTVINCNKDLTQRYRIRNQMIGLKLLDVINFLQREETDDDLFIQLQIFHDSKHKDEEAMFGKTEVDLSSPSELAEALQSRAFGTSRLVSLVNILQDLLAIELLNKIDKDKLWGMVEQQVHHLVHSNRLGTDILASLAPHQLDHMLMEEMQVTGSTRTRGSSNVSNSNNNCSMYDNVYNDINRKSSLNQRRPRTPEPDLLGHLNDMNSPVPVFETTQHGSQFSSKQRDSPVMDFYFPRPSLPVMPRKTPVDYGFVTRRGSLEGQSHHRAFRTLAVPVPSCSMRNLKWIKIQDNIVEWSRGCMWEPREMIPKMEPDYSRLEFLFAETTIMSISEDVMLLAGETRLRINLFLNRLEVEPDELVRNLMNGKTQGLTLPLLKYLDNILPCHDEMLMLRQYSGSLLDLGMAEQFLLHLVDIPDYHILIRGHLTRLEFTSNISRLQKALKAMVSVCRFLLDSETLRDLLQLVLRIGNFLNHGKFNGSVRGIKLSSLQRLKEMNSVEPNHTLLNQIVEAVEESDKRVLGVLSEISRLDEAAKHSPEEIRTDVMNLNVQLKQFVVQLSSAHPYVANLFNVFLEAVKKDLRKMQESVDELREMSKKVAFYLCEPVSTFNLQYCLQHILSFLKDLRTARNENSLYRTQRTQARRRSDHFKTKLKHKRLALEFGKEARASSSMVEDKKKVIEHILEELHHGNFNAVLPLSELSTPEQEELPPVTSEIIQKQITAISHRNRGIIPAATASTTFVEEGSPERTKRPLDLSHISIAGTPMVNRPQSEHFEDDLLQLTPGYSKKGKTMTSSAADLLDDNPLHPQARQQQKLRHSRLAQLAAHNPVASQHHRSKSDLTDSILVHKWLKYEEIKQKERKDRDAPLAAPESSLTLAPLNLENMQARQRGRNHMMTLSQGPVVCVPQSSKDRKAEKRSSISGFFNKLSRAVLKPRNATTNVEQNILHPVQTQEKGRPNKFPSETIDKENCSRKAGEPKRSSKHRLCIQKYS